MIVFALLGRSLYDGVQEAYTSCQAVTHGPHAEDAKEVADSLENAAQLLAKVGKYRYQVTFQDCNRVFIPCGFTG